MSFFDPADKKNKPVLDFFENKTWLIIESNSSNRTSVKKTIVQLGSRLTNMLEADNLVDARDIIETKKPHFVIGNKNINGGSSIPLLELHQKMMPNRLISGFYIIADEAEADEVAIALDFEMDGIVTVPFTGFSIIDTIIKGIAAKLHPTPYNVKIEEGRALYIAGNPDHAMKVFENAIQLSKLPFEGYYFVGQIYLDKKEIEEAIKNFEESLKFNADYYKPLSRLGSLYYQKQDFAKAYAVNMQMAQKFPILPEKIPELIHLSIINKRYEDINNYLKIFSAESNLSPKTQSYLSAGLAVLGKHFIMSLNDEEKGVEALKRAFKLSHGKYEILKSLKKTFKETGKLGVLVELFDSTDMSDWPSNSQVLYFLAMHSHSPDDLAVVTLGEKLLKENIRDLALYRGLLERGLKMKRSSTYIDNLLDEIARYYPDHEQEFRALANRV